MMASKQLRAARRLFRGVNAAKHISVLPLSQGQSLASKPEDDPAACRPVSASALCHSATAALRGSADPTRCRGPCAAKSDVLAAPLALRDILLPARRKLSTKSSGDLSEPRLAENDPRNVPDRPAPPEARRIVEPGQDPLGTGEQKEGYVSLMQQIVGAVKERPMDTASKSRLEALRSRMEEDGAKRGLTKGTVTYAQLAQILSEAKLQKAPSREYLEGVAKKYGVDVVLLGDVLDTVSLASEKPLRDGGKLIGLE